MNTPNLDITQLKTDLVNTINSYMVEKGVAPAVVELIISTLYSEIKLAVTETTEREKMLLAQETVSIDAISEQLPQKNDIIDTQEEVKDVNTKGEVNTL